MISTEPGPDDVLEARIQQALAGERFTVPVSTITGRMSRHRRRTRFAVAAVAIGAAVAAAIPVLSSDQPERVPSIKPPVILPGPTGGTLDNACRSAVMAWLAARADELTPAERFRLPPLRFASDLHGVRVYASNRIELICKWSEAEGRVSISSGWPPDPRTRRMFPPDLDYASAIGSGETFVIGGVPDGTVAVEIEFTDRRVIPARVAGDLFVMWQDEGDPGVSVTKITAIGPNAVYTRPGGTVDTGGLGMTTAADPIGDACEQSPAYESGLVLTAASEALGYRVYAGAGDRLLMCTWTGDPREPVQLTGLDFAQPTERVLPPTGFTVDGDGGEVTFVLGRGDPVDVELRLGGVRLRPVVHDGFYVAAMHGAPDPAGVLHWVLVYPEVVYTGADNTVTSIVER